MSVALRLWILPPGAFRLLLAGLVLLAHLSRAQTGVPAVILFFLLSGYWVSDLWARDGKVLHFFANRFLRIWPLYIIIAAATAIAFRLPFAFPNLALLGVASATPVLPYGVEWSLDIEMQFYLCVPVIHQLAARMRPSAALIAVAIGTALGWAMAASIGFENAFQYLPAFAAGVAVYRGKIIVSRAQAGASLACFAAITIAMLMTDLGQAALNSRVADPIDSRVFAMFWVAPLLPYVVCSLRVSSGALDKHLGDLSFPLYLVHMPVVYALAPLGAVLGPLFKPALMIAAAICALLVYWHIDRPIERWRRRMLEVRNRAGTPAKGNLA